MRQLLNPIFYSPTTRHPDATRQRGARQLAKDRRAARELKRRYTPWVERLPEVRPVVLGITGRWPKKPVQAVYFPRPNGEWRRHELSA